ncbi:MAG: SRPBCC family protein [Planctomycetes bacterium]|nr:SRPBCC family protein [Planctomycetota bacterium]
MNPLPDALPEPHELVLTRLIDAPPAAVFRAWTEPGLMKQWFCPRPWTTPVIEIDVRPGGSSYILMQGPGGEQVPSRGVYLEVVPGKKLVFTDAFTQAWCPSTHAFMVGEITFDDENGKTRYTARVRHWSAADKQQHEQMGFHDGWAKATDQLEALLRSR